MLPLYIRDYNPNNLLINNNNYHYHHYYNVLLFFVNNLSLTYQLSQSKVWQSAISAYGVPL